MKNIKYLIFGAVFSIILIKVEAISWYRIQEMFYFKSFHMYGVLLSGIATAFISIQIIKYQNRSKDHEKKIEIVPKPLQVKANILGGLLFGLGWGISGTCSGPIYSLIGTGVMTAGILLVGALAGTYLYVKLRKYLPQ